MNTDNITWKQKELRNIWQIYIIEIWFVWFADVNLTVCVIFIVIFSTTISLRENNDKEEGAKTANATPEAKDATDDGFDLAPESFVFLLGGCHLARRGRRRWRSSETAALTQQQRNLDIFLYVIVIVIVIVLYVIKTTFDFQSPLIWKVVNFLLAFGNIASNLFRRSLVNIKINNQLESRIIYLRGLKLRVTRGPHETQRKVSRAALKKAKKLPSNLQLKTKNSWKNRQMVYKL